MEDFKSKLEVLVKKTIRVSEITKDVDMTVGFICTAIGTGAKSADEIYKAYDAFVLRTPKLRPLQKQKFYSLANELLKVENRHLVNARLASGAVLKITDRQGSAGLTEEQAS